MDLDTTRTLRQTTKICRGGSLYRAALLLGLCDVLTYASAPRRRRLVSAAPTSAYKKGFTLLEVIITVTIIAAVVTMALPRIGGRSNEVRSAVRKFAVLTRDLRSRAKLNNATYRLVIALSDEEGEEADKNKKQTYWVERAQGEVLNNYDPDDPPKLPSKEDKEKDERDKPPPPPFSPDPKVMKKPEELPADLIFESVELANVKEPITTGIVYIHFLPTGYTDEAVIHLKRGEKVNWTLAIEPLTGRMDIIDEYRKLEDLRSK